MSPARTARRAALGTLFVVVSVVMTFPSVSRLLSHTPEDYGDPFFVQWVLRWDVHALLTHPGGLFNTNIFWPADNTLTYSDTLLAVVPVAAALGALVGWPLTFNLLYLAGWVASLVSTFVLARWFRASTGAAVLAAFVFTFAAPRLANYGHFQLGFAFLFPLAVLALLRFLHDRSLWQAAAVGAVAAAMFLSAVYHALALAVLLYVMVAGWVIAEPIRRRGTFLAGVLVATIVAAALAAPVAHMYLRHGNDLARTADPARPGDVLAPAIGSYLYGPLDRLASRQGRTYRHRLFPGALAVVLGGAGAVDLVRQRRRPADPEGRRRQRALVVVVVASAAVGVLALGPWLDVGGRRVPMPFRLVEALPGFNAVAALSRFAVVPLLGLALLAARGFDRLTAGRSAAVVAAAAAIVGVAMLAEYKIPIETSARVDRPQHTAVNVALRRLDPGPVLELPIVREEFRGYVEAPRMVLSTIDWRPRVNGYSGYLPPGYLRTLDIMAGLGDGTASIPDVLRRLDQLGVRYVVLRTAPMSSTWDVPGVTHYDDDAAQRIVDALPARRVERVSREGQALLVTLRPRNER